MVVFTVVVTGVGVDFVVDAVVVFTVVVTGVGVDLVVGSVVVFTVVVTGVGVVFCVVVRIVVVLGVVVDFVDAVREVATVVVTVDAAVLAADDEVVVLNGVNSTAGYKLACDSGPCKCTCAHTCSIYENRFGTELIAQMRCAEIRSTTFVHGDRFWCSTAGRTALSNRVILGSQEHRTMGRPRKELTVVEGIEINEARATLWSRS